jgi:hypothetical protein
MTYRVYVRWEGQRTTRKTTTDSEVMANAAFEELVADQENLRQQGALGITLGQDGRQLKYVVLDDERSPRPTRRNS